MSRNHVPVGISRAVSSELIRQIQEGSADPMVNIGDRFARNAITNAFTGKGNRNPWEYHERRMTAERMVPETYRRKAITGMIDSYGWEFNTIELDDGSVEVRPGFNMIFATLGKIPQYNMLCKVAAGGFARDRKLAESTITVAIWDYRNKTMVSGSTSNPAIAAILAKVRR